MELPAALLDLIHASPEPLTAVQVKKRLTSMSAKPAAVKKALEDLAQSGALHSFTRGKSAAYCAAHPQELCAKALLGVVAGITAATAPAKLKAALPKTLRPWFEEALGRLIVKGQAWWLHQGRTKLVLPHAPRASDLLTKAQRTVLEKLLAQANHTRRTPRSLDQLLAWLDQESGTEDMNATVVVAQSLPTTLTSTPAAPALTEALLMHWYAEDRGRSSSSMIPIPQTWQRYAAWAALNELQPSPDTFRAVLQSLYDSGRIILEPCERPQDLPDEERKLQVPLAFGPPGYYWGLA